MFTDTNSTENGYIIGRSWEIDYKKAWKSIFWWQHENGQHKTHEGINKLSVFIDVGDFILKEVPPL